MLDDAWLQWWKIPGAGKTVLTSQDQNHQRMEVAEPRVLRVFGAEVGTRGAAALGRDGGGSNGAAADAGRVGRGRRGEKRRGLAASYDAGNLT